MQAEQTPEPGNVGGAQPDRDGAIGADIKAAVGVNRMQTAEALALGVGRSSTIAPSTSLRISIASMLSSIRLTGCR